MLIILLLIWQLRFTNIEAIPLPSVDGFRLYTLCSSRRQTYSREVTDLNTRLNQHPNNQNKFQRTTLSQYIPEFDSTVD